MQERERNLVKLVAKLSPWLAPIPSGYFVARASREHLFLPLPIAIIVGIIIEFLGIASVHTWLWLSDWKTNKRKRDPEAPAGLAALLGGIYIITTVGLTIVLEVIPSMSIVAPAIFPILAVVGAVNLSLIAQQETRERAVRQEQKNRKAARQTKDIPIRRVNGQTRDHLTVSPNETQAHSEAAPGKRTSLQQEEDIRFKSPNDNLDTVKLNTKVDILNTILETLALDPAANITDLARRVGRSRTTVYKYIKELEQAGRISRNGR